MEWFYSNIHITHSRYIDTKEKYVGYIWDSSTAISIKHTVDTLIQQKKYNLCGVVIL